MRINKFIAANSGYSRRKADELITNGSVKINGITVSVLGTDIDPQKDKVTVAGKTLVQNNQLIYLALNKPTGYLATRMDEHGRRTIMDLVPKIPNLKPAGRLDYETEGLIILSNDGSFIHRITHPKFEYEKEYFAEIEGELTSSEKSKLEKGVVIDNRKTSPAKITMVTKSTLKIVIHEGFNRQIRKMFDSVAHPVKYLKRIRIGKIELNSLPKGKYRNLTNAEIHAK